MAVCSLALMLASRACISHRRSDPAMREQGCPRGSFSGYLSSGSMRSIMTTYIPTIGLEIHAELKTRTKMFCGSLNAPHEAVPNTHVCPICMGHPGTLPVINKQAVQHVLVVGCAVNGSLATYTEFDRKNYFYPDIPKGYQISQYAYPLVRGGLLADVEITRIHLEEDTARSIHDKGEGSLIDYNRAGVPLMELVTEPVIHDAETAGRFARELQLLLRTLGVSDANMERGEMRVEANISVSPDESMGTKVEVKNLNSFRSVERAIAYEVRRQKDLLEAGRVVEQETRGWDEVGEKTISQRKKESSHDYRYFPDPDLPKLNISEIPELALSRLDEIMPEIPSEIRKRLGNLGLPRDAVDVLVADELLRIFFDQTIKLLSKPTVSSVIKAANYLVSDIVGYIEKGGQAYTINDASAERFAALIGMIEGGLITSRVAKDILPEVVFESADPQILAKERGLLQTHSKDDLLPVIDEIIQDNQAVVAEYRAGKAPALQFLIGQGMKKTKGSANPETLRILLEERIGSS